MVQPSKNNSRLIYYDDFRKFNNNNDLKLERPVVTVTNLHA